MGNRSLFVFGNGPNLIRFVAVGAVKAVIAGLGAPLVPAVRAQNHPRTVQRPPGIRAPNIMIFDALVAGAVFIFKAHWLPLSLSVGLLLGWNLV